MNTIKAIETHHNGYKFRSRLEARWSVFFQTLGIQYEYEKEGFDLGEAGLYLPDFWIPHQWHADPYPAGNPPVPGLWLEIKPVVPSPSEIVKIEALTKITKHCTYLVAGNIGDGEFRIWKTHPNHKQAWEIPQHAFLFYLDKAVLDVALTNWNEQDGFFASPASHAAFIAARSARFERGR